MSGTGRVSIYRTAWSHPAARWLTVASVQSRLGDFMYGVALYALIYSRTRSATYVAVAAVLNRVPQAVLPPLAGVLADRVERRRLMLRLDASRLLVVAGMAVLVGVRAPVPAIIAAAVVLASLSTPYGPAQLALTASLVVEDDLVAVNAVAMSGESLALLVGPAIGAALLIGTSAPTVFVIDAVTFAASLLCLLRVPAGSPPRGRADGAAGLGISAGVRALAADTRLAIVTVALAATCLTIGATTVLYLVVATHRIGLGAHGYGYLLAANGLGGLLATLIGDRATGSRRAVTTAAVTLLLIAVTIVSLTQVSVAAVALAITVVYGGAYMLQELMSVTLLQRTVDLAVMGRASAAVDMLAFGAILVGAGVTGPLVQHTGLTTAAIIVAAPAAVAAILIILRAGDLSRRAQTGAAELAPGVALLSKVSALAAADQLTLQSLAGHLVTMTVAAGTVVIHEGAPADFLYVVEQGTLTASTLDAATRTRDQIRSFGPGDLFGEIGLVQGRARTADVIAASDVVLARLDGDVFLTAVGALPQLNADLTALAATRLRRGIADAPGI